jgi:prephenate dehydratase
MSESVAYLGPPGTFAEEAALTYLRQTLPTELPELLPYPTITSVARAVQHSAVAQGVVPIENSLEGSVAETLDLLLGAETALHIRAEIILPVVHLLLVRPGTRADEVRTVFSHPQALGQCRRYLDEQFPNAGVVPTTSTAAAVAEMMGFPLPAAAIGTRRAGELYGAVVLAHGIQDHPANETRFVVLAKEDHVPTGRDKTSLSFTFNEDRPGLLVGVLREFADRQINLAKVESRPMKEALGRYHFLVDLEGHRLDELVVEALQSIARHSAEFKVFGSYPRHGA